MADIVPWAVITKQESGTYMTGTVKAVVDWDAETDPPAEYDPATDVLWQRGAGQAPADCEPGWTFVWSNTEDASTLVWTNPNPPPEEG
jgi:hypothetical protein